MLPALSSAPTASCMPTILPLPWLAAASSTASELVHVWPPSVERAVLPRVAATTLISNGPKFDEPQPPATGALRVPQTAYTSPVFWLTKMLPGPPESAHWRSCHSCESGSVIGTGCPNVSPPSFDVWTNMLWLPLPDARLWNRRYTRGFLVSLSSGPTASHWRSVS